MKTIEIEIAVAVYFGYLQNLIVPNISWGMQIHECDLLVITKSGYATEIEIKISRSDIIADRKKRHKHESPKIKYLYFAIPYYLEKDIKHIPERAGIILVREGGRCKTIRKPKMQNKYKFSTEEMYKVARLGAIRIWNLKKKLIK